MLINQPTVMGAQINRFLAAECVASEFDGETDSHSDYSAPLRVVNKSIPMVKDIVVIDNFDWNI